MPSNFCSKPAFSCRVHGSRWCMCRAAIKIHTYILTYTHKHSLLACTWEAGRTKKCAHAQAHTKTHRDNYTPGMIMHAFMHCEHVQCSNAASSTSIGWKVGQCDYVIFAFERKHFKTSEVYATEPPCCNTYATWSMHASCRTFLCTFFQKNCKKVQVGFR
jgi:hypothetical protein